MTSIRQTPEMLLNLLRSSGRPPNEGLLGGTEGENPGASGRQLVGDLGLWVPEPSLPPHCPLSCTWSCSPLARKSCPTGHPRGALRRGRGRQGLLRGRPSFCLEKQQSWKFPKRRQPRRGADPICPKSQTRSPALPLPVCPLAACHWPPPRGRGSLGPTRVLGEPVSS